jgi:hypothetical protein
MKSFARDLVQAAIFAVVIGSPMIVYLLRM